MCHITFFMTYKDPTKTAPFMKASSLDDNGNFVNMTLSSDAYTDYAITT